MAPSVPALPNPQLRRDSCSGRGVTESRVAAEGRRPGAGTRVVIRRQRPATPSHNNNLDSDRGRRWPFDSVSGTRGLGSYATRQCSRVLGSKSDSPDRKDDRHGNECKHEPYAEHQHHPPAPPPGRAHPEREGRTVAAAGEPRQITKPAPSGAVRFSGLIGTLRRHAELVSGPTPLSYRRDHAFRPSPKWCGDATVSAVLHSMRQAKARPPFAVPSGGAPLPSGRSPPA